MIHEYELQQALADGDISIEEFEEMTQELYAGREFDEVREPTRNED
jgi:hypothetical protein